VSNNGLKVAYNTLKVALHLNLLGGGALTFVDQIFVENKQ